MWSGYFIGLHLSDTAAVTLHIWSTDKHDRWNTLSVCFCLSTGSSPNTSLLSDQKAPVIFDVGCGEGEREEVSSSDIQLQSSVTRRNVCWEIIWQLGLHTSKRWEKEAEKKEGERKKAGGDERERGKGGKRQREIMWKRSGRLRGEDTINSAALSPSCHRLSA